MVPLDSTIEDTMFSLYVLEELLKPEGFVIGSSWDYDSGYFDYLIDNKETYYFLRIPFYAVAGSLDYPGVTVRVDKPFLLAHEYRKGVDETAEAGAISGAVDQFQTPTNPDADMPPEYIDMGKDIVKKVEGLLIPS
ncbi:YugN-like family protein [Virgibacillus necropolis]|uniref:YugN family protein n=1 Tax=Virgibacillus necropolis TaxID=163877 RepID=UPI00384E4524